ncbi:myb-like protein X [Xenia sp. Carnegie-2017]|uniref:myb-like protein X n=1 Tax=Xenia sp. Carnegie-2017 TaxID=2897299 RepID=UPI001F0440A9|nr:myb-like protein X [Xenia sp. Carnegie-2017]XP_046839153.1 myb-like protein X [Xenia sp. Carnegie-2017]
MEQIPTPSLKVGKYPDISCLQSKADTSSKIYCVKSISKTSDSDVFNTLNSSKMKYEVNLSHSSQVLNNTTEYSKENMSKLLSNATQKNGQGFCIKYTNSLCHPKGTSRFIGKPSGKSSADLKKNGEKFLTRSTSCGNINYLNCEDNDMYKECLPSSNVHNSLHLNHSCLKSFEHYKSIASTQSMLTALPQNSRETNAKIGENKVMLSLINGPMQSIIDSKDEKIKALELAVDRLECKNKQMKHDQQPQDMTKFYLRKTLENCIRQIEKQEEENKTSEEKMRLLEDLRKNDKECIDILRAQTTDLEMKLCKSDEEVQWLKQQYEKEIEELKKSLKMKDSKLRDISKVKLRVTKQKQDFEAKQNNDNEFNSKMCRQVIELKQDLQLHQTRLSILEREKKSLQESLSQSENLQRQDQKSSYVLQMKIVELQEKLDFSYKKNDELEKQCKIADDKLFLAEEKLKQSYRYSHIKLTRHRNKANHKDERTKKGMKFNEKEKYECKKSETSRGPIHDKVKLKKAFSNNTTNAQKNEMKPEKFNELQDTMYMKQETTAYQNHHQVSFLTKTMLRI